MAIRVAAQRKALATQYGSQAPYGALFSADPGSAGAATNELTGGGYARQALNWAAVTDNGTVASIVSAATPFNVASGTNVNYAGVCVSSTAATADVRDSVSVPTQNYASAGTYTVSATFTQS